MIELLKPLFRGELAAHGETLVCGDPAAAVVSLPPLAALIAADRAYLLEQEKWPDGRRNPLFGRRKQATSQSSQQSSRDEPILLHRQCCLHYRLPGETYCGACPLSPALRQARGAPLTDAA